MKQNIVLWWSSCGVLGGESESDELGKEKRGNGSWKEKRKIRRREGKVGK